MGGHNQCVKNSENESLSAKAYELWEEDGCQQGEYLKYRMSAEKSIKSQSGLMKIARLRSSPK